MDKTHIEHTKGLRFKEGDFVKLTKRNHGHAFEIGETVMISIATTGNNGNCCDVYSHGWQNNPVYSVFNAEGYFMNVGDCEVEISSLKNFNRKPLFRSWQNKKKLSFFLAKDPSLLQNWNLRTGKESYSLKGFMK